MSLEDDLFQKKNVVIVGNTSGHHSYIKVLIQLLDNSSLTLIINEVMEQILHDTIKNAPNVLRTIVITGTEVFTEDIKAIINDADGVVFDEPFSLVELKALMFRKIHAPFYLTVHNCNSWFFPRYGHSPKQILVSYLRKRIMRKTHNVIVMNSNIRDFLREKKIRKNVLVIPFDYEKNVSPAIVRESDDPRLRVIVPGTVSNKRDYNKILDIYYRDQFRDTTTLELLGPPVGEYGKKILKRCKEIVSEGYDIVYYETDQTSLPKEIWLDGLSRADVILTVFDIDYTTIDKQHEVYGLTKDTGLSYLALTQAKAAIMPSAYRAPREIASQILPYDTVEEIPGIIMKLIQNPEILTDYKKQAALNASLMNMNSIREQNA
ncbi:hypothetical protein ACFL47_09745 [Candidatus Latescibacterota bacterium]